MRLNDRFNDDLTEYANSSPVPNPDGLMCHNHVVWFQVYRHMWCDIATL